MIIGEEEAKSLKHTMDGLMGSPDGQLFLEFMADRAGFHKPAYNPEIASTIHVAAGRTEMIMIMRNLGKLTVEEIIQLCQEGQ